MIVNAARTLALSNFGSIEAGDLWVYGLGEPEPKQIHLSDAKRLTLIQGIEDFAVVHHFEDNRVELTSHSYRNISEVISSIELRIKDVNASDIEMIVSRFAGETSAWSFLPKAYIVRPFEESLLLLVDWRQKAAHLQSLSWHKESYGTLYHMILGVTEVPHNPFSYSLFNEIQSLWFMILRQERLLGSLNWGEIQGPHNFFFVVMHPSFGLRMPSGTSTNR
jgi:hypothetical protein